MTDDEKIARQIAAERRAWWQLRECYARCVQIAHDEWDAALDLAQGEQHELAVEMRDRVREGTRATGAKYEVDYGIPVPLLTPRDRAQFVKEAAVTLFIEACKKSLPVTPEGKRAAQKADATGDTAEAGSGVDETLKDEVRQLAQAGETVEGSGAPAVLGA